MKKILIPVLVIILAAGGYYLYSRNETAAEKETLTLYGNIDIRDVTLGFRVSGRIAEMRFEEGDQIRRGDVVAVLDKEPFLDDLALAQAELDEATATAANALRVYKRRAELVKTGAVSQDKYDKALTNRNMANARKVTVFKSIP